MKKPINVFCLGILAAVLPCISSAEEIDGIAAKVGTESILKSDVQLEMRRMRASGSAYSKALDELIERQLVLKSAKDSGVTLQEWVVENRIREIIKGAFGGDRNKLMEMLSRQKVSYTDWRARMKDDMVIAAMRWNVIDRNITASPKAMREYYAAHQDRYRVGSKVSVSVILLKPEDEGKREEVIAELSTNAFEDVARKYSADPHAAEGGLWEKIDPAEQFQEEICAEIARMPKGTLSDWVTLDGWNFLLRKEDVLEGPLQSFTEAYDKIEADVKDLQSQKAYRAWIERLKKEIYIKVY